MENKVLCNTTYETIDSNGVDLTIKLERSKNYSNVIRSFQNINGFGVFVNNKHINAGELCFVVANTLEGVDAFIEQSTGELFISGNDAKNYSIDEDGNLIYTFR